MQIPINKVFGSEATARAFAGEFEPGKWIVSVKQSRGTWYVQYMPAPRIKVTFIRPTHKIAVRVA